MLDRARMRGWPCVVLFVALAGDAIAQPEPTPENDPPPTDPAPTDPPATPAPPKPEEKKPPEVEPAKAPGKEPDEKILTISESDRGFKFGSYGRIIAGTDLRGGKPESANVVAHGPRIVEPSYLELDLSFTFHQPSIYTYRLRPVITLAFDGTLFHDTGEFDAQPALRNLYLDAELTRNVTAWVGSRMYRGDDIYLFDYWPLDDQNTVGGGVIYRRQEMPGEDTLEIAGHAGVNRLLNNFQFQDIDVPNPEQGSTTVVQLNRQRLVVSGSVTYILAGKDDLNIKAKMHGEFHALPSGTRKRVDGTFEKLPADNGYVIGAQLGAFGFSPDNKKFRRHANVFVRYAAGLASFDELAPPTSFGSNLKTTRASELSVGMSSNWDTQFGHLMVGALSRRVIDADGPGADYDDGWEYAIGARPLAKIPGLRGTFAGADVSYQARFPRGLNPTTQTAQDPSVFQIAPMLVFSPMGPSGYDRPQIRIVYRAAFLNQAAQDLYVPGDPRANDSVTHFLGFQAEWWFNSTTYR